MRFVGQKWGMKGLIIAMILGFVVVQTGLLDMTFFTGGTQVIAKFREAPDLSRLRTSLAELASGSPVIQRFDEAEQACRRGIGILEPVVEETTREHPFTLDLRKLPTC